MVTNGVYSDLTKMSNLVLYDEEVNTNTVELVVLCRRRRENEFLGGWSFRHKTDCAEALGHRPRGQLWLIRCVTPTRRRPTRVWRPFEVDGKRKALKSQ